MSYCTNCGHALDGDSGFCSYCGAEHSADGEVALPGRAGKELDPGGTLAVTPKAGGTVPVATTPAPASYRPPRFQTETPVANTATPAVPQTGGHSRSRLVVVLAIIVIVVACAAAAAIILFGRDSGASTAAVSPSPSAVSTANAVVKITSHREGNEVVGGQRLRVTVMATGVVGMKQLRLLVNGVPTGPIKEHTGPDGDKTTTFPWRPPAKGDDDVSLAAEAVLDDGTFLRSEVVRVVVRPAVVPTATVVVTAQPEPTYESEGGTGDGGSEKTGLPLDGSYVVLIASETTYSEAEDWFNTLLANGWENAGILDSDDYLSDLSAGYYCPYVGPYYSSWEAQDALSALKEADLGESPRIENMNGRRGE
jgi:hypothetical protein